MNEGPERLLFSGLQFVSDTAPTRGFELEFSLGLLTNFNGFITTIQLAYSNGQQA
jgi:hypothetical protein